MINALRTEESRKYRSAFKLVPSKIGFGHERSGSIERRVKFETLIE